jgi:hypothetical protein
MCTILSPLDIYKISEIYIHLRLDYNSEKTEKLASRLKNIASDNFSDFRYSDALLIDVATEGGSVKFNINIYGALIKKCTSDFGSLNNGLTRILYELKQISGLIIETGRREELDIDLFLIRSEKRTGLPGRLKRTLDDLNMLLGKNKGVPAGKSNSDLKSLLQELSDMIELLGRVERRSILDSLPDNLRNHLPVPDEDGMVHLYNLYAYKQE